MREKEKKVVVEITKGAGIDGERYYPGDVVELGAAEAGLLIGQKMAVESKKKPELLPRKMGTELLEGAKKDGGKIE